MSAARDNSRASAAAILITLLLAVLRRGEAPAGDMFIGTPRRQFSEVLAHTVRRRSSLLRRLLR